MYWSSRNSFVFGTLSSFLYSRGSAEQQYLGIESHSENYKFDPLKHLPGISPYFDAIGFGLEHKAPLGCKVSAASYLIRHAAIYANDNDYEQFIEPFIAKISSGEWKGPLAFINDWVNPLDDPENQMEMITPQGFKESVKVGKHLLQRYPSLIPTTKKIYADKKDRTQDTAKAFVKAFEQDVEIVEISHELEFHAQIPHKYCPAFTKKSGDKELAKFIAQYTRTIIARLSPYAPVQLTRNDIVGMQQLCGYESAMYGNVSKFCAVFTDIEWMSYEYAWDLKYSYMVGHNNPLSPYLGFPWLNMTSGLFSQIENDAQALDGQKFFLSFTHREVPPFIATALGLFNSSSSSGAEAFPTDVINFSRSWKMAELIPFLGHVGLEKLTCTNESGADSEDFVRVIANTAPRPIPVCQGGPGGSCRFQDFLDMVELGMHQYGDFHGVCGYKKGKKGKKVQ